MELVLAFINMLLILVVITLLVSKNRQDQTIGALTNKLKVSGDSLQKAVQQSQPESTGQKDKPDNTGRRTRQ